jgi:Domain of unknown function (DUF1876)/Domain of unknown function (DUF1918)
VSVCPFSAESPRWRATTIHPGKVGTFGPDPGVQDGVLLRSSQERGDGAMKAYQGDRIILAARHTDEPTRDGVVLEVRGQDGGPPYLVRWSDGHTGLMYPGPGSVLRVEAEHGHEAGVPAQAPHASADGPTAAGGAPTVPHVREWQVRVSIFESGDDTSANVVLLTEAPTHLTAHGQSLRGTGDPFVPEIGDEVAVARALRHLADQLLETAALDLEVVTGRRPTSGPAERNGPIFWGDAKG